ncbi:hypothetical protein K438DRAFT_1818488 [Mycena galopus ATCC 62051]|nr:hypothetical protein K438DRAFT_1818488 [Mycena galopus ATCC 62051]
MDVLHNLKQQDEPAASEIPVAVGQSGILGIGLVHKNPAVVPPPPQSEGFLEKLGLENHDTRPTVVAQTMPPQESVREKLGLEHRPAPPPPPMLLPHEGAFGKLGLENHVAPVPELVPKQESLLEEIGTERNHHTSRPPAPPAPPKHQGVLEELLDQHAAPLPPPDPAAPKHEGILEKLGLEDEHDAPPPLIPPKHQDMLEKMRHEHEQPRHPHESANLLENLRAGWVTPPPPPPLHEQKIGLVLPPPPLAPKPAGSARLGKGSWLAGRRRLRNRSMGWRRTVGRTRKKASADFVHEHVHSDEYTSEKIADAVKREYQKVEHSLENYYE